MSHEPIGVAADPVAAAASLRPLLERNAERSESERRLAAENVDAIAAANLFKVMTPRRWGGYGSSLAESVNTFAELAKGCGSSGWVTMILAGVGWWASMMPDRGQEEVLGSGGNSRVCGSSPPGLKARSGNGGLRISGKFPFASGCLHAGWADLVVEVENETNHVTDQVNAFVPMTDLEIEDTWFVAGMCGTGSSTLVAKDVFVPLHRTYSVARTLSGEHAELRHKGEPSDSYAFVPANCLIGLAPVIGLGHAMLEEVIAGTAKRGISLTMYSHQSDSAVVQNRIAEAAVRIESAHLQALNIAEQIHQAAVAGTQIDYLARARMRGTIGYCARILREGIDALISIGGASAFASSSRMQRIWRDANVATRHVLLATESALEIYGNALLGLEKNISPFV